ncbi:MAG: periplasmic heavy metal sensor [Nitrospirota bacterium]
MRNFVSIMLFVLVTLMFGASNLSAQACGCIDRMGGMHDGDMSMMGGMMGGMGRHGMMQGIDANHPLWRMLMNLGLDSEQKEALKEIKSRVMKETIKKIADKSIAELEVRDLLDEDPVDMKAVEDKLKRIETLRTEILFSHIKALEEMKSKLTPDQREKLKGLMEMSMMRGMMGPPAESEKEEKPEKEISPKGAHGH